MLTSLALVFLVGLAAAALCQRLRLPRSPEYAVRFACGLLHKACKCNDIARGKIRRAVGQIHPNTPARRTAVNAEQVSARCTVCGIPYGALGQLHAQHSSLSVPLLRRTEHNKRKELKRLSQAKGGS